MTTIGWDAQGRPIDDSAVAAWDEHGNPIPAHIVNAPRPHSTRYTAENFRTGRSPSGGHDIPIPEALIPFAMGAQDIAGGISDFSQQIIRNLGVGDELSGGANAARQSIHNLATGDRRQLPAQAYTEAAQGSQAQQADFAQAHPGLDVAASVAGIPATAGVPAAGGAPMSVLRAGLTAGAFDTPFAVARQEGELPARIQAAAPEIGSAALLGGGLQGVANALLPRLAPQAASRAAQFERAGVRPTMAAINGGVSAGATKMIAENFLAGAGVRARLQGSLDDTASAASRLAGQFGEHGPSEQVGEAVQGAVRRFSTDGAATRPAGARAPEAIPTREWSFDAKASALYDHVFDRLAREEAAHLEGQTGATVTTAATQAALQRIQSQVSAPSIAEIVQSPLLGRIRQAIETDQGAIRFQDLRQLRTWVREAQRDTGLRQNTSQGALQQLEGALTNDIYASARELGGPYAEQMLRRTDNFYRAGMQRIRDVLQPFANASPRGAYDRIVSLARDGGRQNSRALQSLRNSLRPDEWRNVASTVIDNMGRTSAGHPEALQSGAFSVDRFVTEYAKLSPEGRRVLFGGRGTEELAAALDNLAQVAGYQKGVEAMANRSRSGVNVQNVGTAGGLLNPSTAAPTAGLLAGMAITGEMLTNPAFVRWVTSASRSPASVGGMRRQLSALANLAARDPALAPVYADLTRRAGERLQNREARTQRTPELVQ